MPGEARRGRSTQCGEPVTFYAIYYQSEYNYTGTVQTFTAPVDGWYKVQLWGAAGGDDGDHHGWRQGGKGGYVEAEIKLEAEQKIYVYIGAPGMDNVTATGAGYNGGGNPGTDGYSGSGGGASDIRLIDGEWDNPVGLSTRILVAGGGGGAGLRGDGGYGGGLVGGNGRGDAWNDQYGNNFPGGDGGTQTSAGNRGGFGYGGTNGADGGGGGGGWYGGGARGPCRPSDSGPNDNDVGGGGGSSYIGGYGSIQIRNAYTKAGNEQMPSFDGGFMTGNDGPCHARFLIVEWS